MTKIANIGQTVEPIDSLHPHPRNPNQGDVGAISESIDAHGFYGHIIAQQSSRTILAGEHRWRAARAAVMPEVPVTWIDVDDEQALRIVLVDNCSSELGRVARPIELDPGYCDVICKRHQGVTGIVPVRDSDPHDFLT